MRRKLRARSDAEDAAADGGVITEESGGVDPVPATAMEMTVGGALALRALWRPRGATATGAPRRSGVGVLVERGGWIAGRVEAAPVAGRATGALGAMACGLDEGPPGAPDWGRRWPVGWGGPCSLVRLAASMSVVASRESALDGRGVLRAAKVDGRMRPAGADALRWLDEGAAPVWATAFDGLRGAEDERLGREPERRTIRFSSWIARGGSGARVR